MQYYQNFYVFPIIPNKSVRLTQMVDHHREFAYVYVIKMFFDHKKYPSGKKLKPKQYLKQEVHQLFLWIKLLNT